MGSSSFVCYLKTDLNYFLSARTALLRQNPFTRLIKGVPGVAEQSFCLCAELFILQKNKTKKVL